MSYSARRPVWHLALIDDEDDGCAPSLLLHRQHRGTRVIDLADFGRGCPYGAACATVRALLPHRRSRSQPASIHLRDSRLARRLYRVVRPRGGLIRLRAAWPTLDEARDGLPGGPDRWRWHGGEERPRPAAPRRRAA